MVDVTNFGTTTLKKVKVNTLNGVADTNKNPDERRTVTFISNDDTGIGSSLFFELKLGGTITLNELYFSPEAKMRNIQSNGVGTLIPRSNIDTFVDGNFTLYPTRLITPMDKGWGNPPFDDVFTGKVDAGIAKGGVATGGHFSSLFIVNKPIPVDGGVYVEFDFYYAGDSSSPSYTPPSLMDNIMIGFATQNAYQNYPTTSPSWGSVKVFTVDGTASVAEVNGAGWANSKGASGFVFNSTIIASADGYIDESTNSGVFFRTGLKLQLGYNPATDDLELILFDGPGADGTAHGTRFRYAFPAATDGDYVNDGSAYYALTLRTSTEENSQCQISLSKNKLGYYLGDLTDMIELV